MEWLEVEWLSRNDSYWERGRLARSEREARNQYFEHNN